MNAVIDSSAVIALILQEEGAAAVAAFVAGASISAVNYAEVLEVLGRRGMDASLAHSAFASLGIEIAPFDAVHARRTAALAPVTRHLGLSLGDRACLAVAEQRGVSAITADRRWAEAGVNIKVTLIR
ncbi:MAG: type II toxin-antitoxin system VapC family toxin [Alphaproteobacteria bacterium]|nr:type II toxin-antitoxin system VapC family toxin [Alphaproteobacteria bacterium]